MQVPAEDHKQVLPSRESTGFDRRSVLLGIAASFCTPILATLASADDVSHSYQATRPELIPDFEKELSQRDLLGPWEEVLGAMRNTVISGANMREEFDSIDPHRVCPSTVIEDARSKISGYQFPHEKGVFMFQCRDEAPTIFGRISVSDNMLDVTVHIVTGRHKEITVDDTTANVMEKETGMDSFPPPVGIRLLDCTGTCIAQSRLSDKGIASFELKKCSYLAPFHIEFCQEDTIDKVPPRPKRERYAPGEYVPIDIA